MTSLISVNTYRPVSEAEQSTIEMYGKTIGKVMNFLCF